MCSTSRSNPALAAAASRCPALEGEVRFDAVKFRYGLEGRWTLENINLDVPAAQRLEDRRHRRDRANRP